MSWPGSVEDAGFVARARQGRGLEEGGKVDESSRNGCRRNPEAPPPIHPELSLRTRPVNNHP